MAIEDDLKKHPKGQVHCEGSQLMQSTMGKFTFSNGATMKHTMGKKFNGIVLGLPDCAGTLDIDVAEDGLEQDWIGLVRSGQFVAFQFEMPTLNVEITGVISSIDAELPMDGCVKFTVSWIGKMGQPVPN